tara:strand:- start:283 stop:570 length:288 start_codon:yes stop_codon:yes gene_type:complete
MKNNIDYIIIIQGLKDITATEEIIEDLSNINLGNISEKEAFELYYKEIAKDNEFSNEYEYLYELRQYDTLEDDYLDWDMSESKYYNKGVSKWVYM